MSRSIHETRPHYRDASETSFSSEEKKQTLLRSIWDRIRQKRLHKRNTKRGGRANVVRVTPTAPLPSPAQQSRRSLPSLTFGCAT